MALVMPLRDMVVFPHMVSPVFVSRETTMRAIHEAQTNNHTVIGLTQKDPELENPTSADFLPIGVEMAVGRLLSMPDGSSSALVQGRRRVEVVEFLRMEPVIKVRAKVIFEPGHGDKQTQALMRSVLDQFDHIVQLDRSIPEEAHLFALNISEPGWLADMIATTSLNIPVHGQDGCCSLLRSPRERLQAHHQDPGSRNWMCLKWRMKSIPAFKAKWIEDQREFYLREQMKQIQNELGEGDIFSRDILDLREKIQKANLPEEAESGRAQGIGPPQPDAAHGARSGDHPHLP